MIPLCLKFKQRGSKVPLEDVKSKFVGITGRRDLISPNANPDAAWYINAGQKRLDHILTGGRTIGRWFSNLALSQILVLIPSCRFIKNVFLYSVDGRVELVRCDVHKLREYYAEPKASLDAGAPEYYSPICIRPYPKDITNLSTGGTVLKQVWALESMVLTGYQSYNAIVIMPPVDNATSYSLEVWGGFYSDTLINPEDATYWTEVYPQALIKAAAYELEVMYRNTEGAKDWMTAINLDMVPLVHDYIEEESEGIIEIGG